MVSKKIILTGILIFLLLFIVKEGVTQSDIALADMYYEEAKKLYEQGNCKNASQLVNRAYNLYSKHSNQPGMEKCNELDAQIDQCLRGQGYNKYQEGVNQLRNNQYETAKAFALEAKELFSLIPDEEWVSKCDELIQQIEKKIKENLEFRADNFYEEAMNFYQASPPDYLSALDRAKKAKELYAEIPLQTGIQKCENLIENIRIDMQQIKAKANLYYTYAEEWYTKAQINPIFKNFNTALDYAKKASKLYSLVNDTQGYSSAKDLITFLNNEIEKNEDRLRKEAEDRFDKAELEYLKGRRYFHEEKYELAYETFKNATSYSNYAKATYLELYKWAESVFNYEKKEYYKKKIRECDSQLEKINKEMKTIDKRKKAEELYKKAYEFKGNALYENASKAVREAKKIFEEIGDWSAVSKCVTLIRDIDEALGIQGKADKFYQNASYYYHQADFDNATYYAKEAKKIYQSINKYEGVNKSNELLKKIKKGNESKTNANKLLKNAWELHDRGTFTKSIEFAERAKQIYQAINYSRGVNQSAELISKNKGMLKKVKEKEELYRNIVVLVITLIVILLAARWRWEKKKKEELRRKREELDRRREEALKRKREEAKRRAEEERLRRIKEERERVMKALAEERRKNE